MKKYLFSLIGAFLIISGFAFTHPALAATQVVTSTGSGSWTVPAGVTSVQIEMWGGGGGGAPGGGGGGAGAYVIKTALSVTPGDTITYNIATGGTGGSWSTAGTGGTGYRRGGNGARGGTILNYGGGGGGSSSVVVSGTTYIASGGGGMGQGFYGNPTGATGSSGGAGGSGGYAGNTGIGGGGGSGIQGTDAVAGSSAAPAGGTGGTTQTGTNGTSGSTNSGGGSSAGASGNGKNAPDYSSAGATGSNSAATGAAGTGSDSGGGGNTTATAGQNGGQPGAGGGGTSAANTYQGGTGGAGQLIITYNTSTGAIGWTNSLGYITTSTNNFGGLTNASVTALSPIIWSSTSTISCPTCITTAVTSLAGTANQIAVSTSTGSVIISATNPFIDAGLQATTITATTSIADAGTLNVSGTAAFAQTSTFSGNVSTTIAANSFVATNAQGILVATGTPSGSVTTSSAGVANTLPMWTSASALGNSNYTQSGTSTFINESSTYIGTNTSTANSSLVWISNYAGAGYWDATGTIPTLSSCGTSPTSTGNIDRMRITVGSVSATGCTVTFPIAFKNIPSCIVTNESMSVVNAMSYAETTSTLTVTQTGLTGDILDASCEGQGE